VSTKELTEQERIARIAELADEYAKEGEVEFDQITAADISESDDNGAYVRCWCWIDFAGTDLDKEAEDDEDQEDDDENDGE
jgi:hypothetical protein